jgi:hypothetical protein
VYEIITGSAARYNFDARYNIAAHSRSREIACRVSKRGKVGTMRVLIEGIEVIIEAFKKIMDEVRLFLEAVRVLAEYL